MSLLPITKPVAETPLVSTVSDWRPESFRNARLLERKAGPPELMIELQDRSQRPATLDELRGYLSENAEEFPRAGDDLVEALSLLLRVETDQALAQQFDVTAHAPFALVLPLAQPTRPHRDHVGRRARQRVPDLLDTWEAEGKNRMAQAMRSLAYDFFRAAQAKGWIKDNPVAPTKSPDVDVKRARLTLEDFQAIHAVALKDMPVLARAMELALVTGQRREEVLTLGPGNVRDGKLWIEQKKTRMKVRVPLELRLQAVTWSVSEVISRCRDHVLSRTFIHHVSHGGTARPGDRVGGSTLAGWFLAARNQSGRTWPAEGTPPSFHEIRSLAARLYHDQGVNAQALLGHKSAEMTALYRDTRGAEWVDVAP